MYEIKEDAVTPLVFLMISSADHISPITGLSPTVTISKNGAAFASPAGAVTEIANGWYQVAGNASDSDTVGPVILHATAGGADPTDAVYNVVDGLVNLGPTQTTTIYGNISGSVGSVTAPVTCTTSTSTKCCRCRCC